MEQTEIATAIAEEIPELAVSLLKDREGLVRRLRATRLGELIEFSRAVHAEMECLLVAARQGKNTKGTRMFVTTFPCHFCARHIVSAGVDEVPVHRTVPQEQSTPPSP